MRRNRTRLTSLPQRAATYKANNEQRRNAWRNEDDNYDDEEEDDNNVKVST